MITVIHVPDSVPIVIRVLLALLVIPAAAFDLRSRRVPNWLTLSAGVAGIGINIFCIKRLACGFHSKAWDWHV